MASHLSDHLSAARRRRFVGRADELALFEGALAAAKLPFHLIYLYGVGGVGKTTLLAEFARRCLSAGTPLIALDGHTIEPAHAALLTALRHAMSLAPSDSPLQALAVRTDRYVLVIDSYEALAPLDTWVREVFLPQLPSSALVVLADRHPPAPAWRADPGWASLVQTVALSNLSPQESLAYLARRGVPGAQQQAALTFTRGHPLALALVADVIGQQPDVPIQPEAIPDVLQTLLKRFCDQVPDTAHRSALEACALVHVMTEDLLAEMLALPDAFELFAWLRGLSFIESGPLGLFPHDLARETLAADLRWRSPDSFAQLSRRAARYYIGHLQHARDWEQERLLFEFLFLHRHSPAIRPLFTPAERTGHGGVVTDRAREGDVPMIVAMVAQHEGEDSARLAAHWLARQLEHVVVFREDSAGSRSGLAGFVIWVMLPQASAEDIDADPATRAAWQYVQRHAPLRPGEGALYRRFWMARETYQDPSPVASLVIVDWQRHLLTTPGLGPAFKAYANPELWAPVVAYAELAHIPDADFAIGGRHYAVFGLDLRALPLLTRLTQLAEKINATPEPRRTQIAPISRPIAFLSQPELATAVHAALRSWSQPDLLRGNPLLCSRLVAARVGASASEVERVVALRAAIQEAAEMLQASPRQSKGYRALYHTYLHPAATQQQAAERLDLPFSTFRRHLHAGIENVTAILWRWEIDFAEM